MEFENIVNEKKVGNKLNIGDLQMLLCMANGYTFDSYVDTAITAKKIDADGFNQMMFIQNVFEDVSEEKQVAVNQKYATLSLIKNTLKKSVWNNNYDKIEALYDKRRFERLWNLLAGYTEGNKIQAGIMNDKAVKNFIGVNSPEYLKMKHMGCRACVDVLNFDGPYIADTKDGRRLLDKNPFHKVIKVTHQTLDTMGNTRMYNDIWKHTKEGIDVDPELYSKSDSLRFWKKGAWYKEVKSQKQAKSGKVGSVNNNKNNDSKSSEKEGR